MATAGLAGWLADSALTAAGLLRFGDASTAPLWMAGLWVAFAATLGSSLSWLRGRPWIAALFGALGGPLAYGGGARLEALGTTATGLGAVAVEWALAAPALVRIHGVFTGGER